MEIVYTSKQFCDILKHIALDLKTKYDNSWKYNLGYNHGTYWSWDCWNLPKTIIWGWNENIPVGSYVYNPGLHGLGDWGGWTILNCCDGISRDFSQIAPGEFLLTEDKGHAGIYVGEFKDRYGQPCNVVECTTGWGEWKVIGSWVDPDSTRRASKGKATSTPWHWHGRLPWIDYAEVAPVEKVVGEDGWWGPDTTRWTQRFFGTLVDGEVSRQPSSNKKWLVNATGGWQFFASKSKFAGGSAMVKALQTFLGVEADGWFGPQTVKALQIFLRAEGLYDGSIDGYLGPKSVLGWQKYLNRRFS